MGVALRIFVCDDSFGYRMLIGNWCELYEGVEAAGQATSADELLRLLPAAEADVLLLDLMLGEQRSSPELVASIREAAPGIRIVLASSMPDDVLRTETERIGADGCCSKLASADELFAAITGH
jgi:DNA-binding NarL/FixJ family response regulator